MRFSNRPAPAPTPSPVWRTAPRLRPTRCCRARSRALGLIVTEGFRHILEIARQAVPDGYGNSYFWVKPERIVPLAIRARGRRPAQFPRARNCARSTRTSVREAARYFRARGIKAVGVCLMHSYANAAHERRVGEIVARGISGMHGVAVLRRAAGISRIRARDHDAGRCLRQAAHGPLSQARA